MLKTTTFVSTFTFRRFQAKKTPLISVSACWGGQFYCPEGYCIPASWTCDQIVDCKDGSDEGDPVCCKVTFVSATLAHFSNLIIYWVIIVIVMFV